MSKYSYRDQQAKKSGGREIHPIWRGVGFAFIILIPIISYAATQVILEQNKLKHWFPIPSDLIAPGRYPLLYIDILGTVAIALALYAVFMLIAFIVYSIFAPPRYGPMDAPPIRARKVKKAR